MCNIFPLLITIYILGSSEGFLENEQTSSGSTDISNLLNLLVEEKTLRQKLEQRVEQMDKQLGILSERGCTCDNSGPSGINHLESLIQAVHTIQLNKDDTLINITVLQQDVKSIVDENANLRHKVTELQKQNDILKNNITSVQEQSLNGTKKLENMVSSLTAKNVLLQNQLQALQSTLHVYEDSENNKTSNLIVTVSKLKSDQVSLVNQYQNMSNMFSEFKKYQQSISSTIQLNLSRLEKEKNGLDARYNNVSNYIASFQTQLAQLNQDKNNLMVNITDVLAIVKQLQQLQGQNTVSIHGIDVEVKTLHQLQSTATQRLQTLTNNIKTVTDTVASIRDPVGFTVRLTTGTFFSGRTYNPSETLPFSNIIKSIGGGFNSTNGIFYCPKTGTYLFEVTLSSYSAAASVNIVVNGQSLAYAYSSLNANNIYESGSVMQIVRLNKGDRVWIRSRGSYFIENYSYFSGVLITA